VAKKGRGGAHRGGGIDGGTQPRFHGGEVPSAGRLRTRSRWGKEGAVRGDFGGGGRRATEEKKGARQRLTSFEGGTVGRGFGGRGAGGQ
jgi:hypothetical protein